MRWFRFYSEALHDPKVRQLPGRLFKDWVLILCIANEGRPRGALPGTVDIGYHLNRSPERVKALLADLQGRGFLDESAAGFIPHNWGGRQFDSDSRDSEGRRIHDEARRKDGAVWINPPPTRAAVAPPLRRERAVTDTDTEAETETEQSTSPPTPLPPAAGSMLAVLTNLYENEIGTLTPGVADSLRDWSERIPENRFALAEYAFGQAVANNRRSWSYVQAILKRLEADGWPVEPEKPATETPELAAARGAARRTPDKEEDWLRRRYEKSGKGSLR